MARTKTKILPKTGYRFKDKDPAIDAFRAAMESSGLSIAQVSQLSNVSATTLHNWDYGNTLKPQHATLRSAMEACGYREQWVNGERSIIVNYVRERGQPSFKIRKLS